MEKDVIIYLNGLQYAHTEEGTEPLQVIAPGQYYFKNGSHYLLYEDAVDSGEEKTKNILKFRTDHLEVIKNGSISTKLMFEKDKKTLSQYQTPFGGFVIGVSTTSVELKEKEDSIEVVAKYAMDVNNNFVADCEVSVMARSKKSGMDILSS